KHLMASSNYPNLTVFRNAGLRSYAHHIVNTMAPGAVRIDQHRRRSIIWVAGFEIGCAYSSGVPTKPVNGIVLVLSSDPVRAHVFPVDTADLVNGQCVRCGGAVITAGARLVPDSTYRV